MGGFDEGFLAQRGNGRGHDALGEILVVHVRDIEDAEAVFPESRVEVFAAQLEVERAALGVVMVGGFQHRVV